MKLLHLDSSAVGKHSVTRTLTAALAEHVVRHQPDTEVVYRDLTAQPIPHWEPVADVSRDPDAVGQQVLDEFLASEIIIIGAPMYNFGIPSQLKAWIDRIAVPGKTFRYTENGPQGLAGDKRVIIASSRGGIYSQGPAAAMEHQESYLRTVLGFFGITDIEIVRAEGVAMGDEQRERAVQAAIDSIEELSQAA